MTLEYDDDVTTIGVYLLSVNNRSTKNMCEVCLKLRIKTPEQAD